MYIKNKQKLTHSGRITRSNLFMESRALKKSDCYSLSQVSCFTEISVRKIMSADRKAGQSLLCYYFSINPFYKVNLRIV